MITITIEGRWGVIRGRLVIKKIRNNYIHENAYYFSVHLPDFFWT